MHEMALCRDVVDIVVDYAAKAGAAKVTDVVLTVGEVRDIVEDLFQGCFQYLARNTVAAQAELTIVRVPLMVECRECGRVYHIDVHDDKTWPCRKCGAKNYRLKSGMEFRIDNIGVLAATEPARGALCPQAVPA